jgi:O-antigen/teichoic acid export membrane protein
MSDIKKKFLFQLLYAFSQLLFPLLTYPYLTRTIGADGLGKIAFIEYSTGLIITIVSFGIPFYGVREIAKVMYEPQKRYAVFSQLFYLHIAASIAGVGAFICFMALNNPEAMDQRLVVLGCLNIMLPVFVADWYMQGTEAFKFTTLRNIALRVLGIIALFLLVKDETHYIRYFLLTIIIQAFVAASNLYVVPVKRIRLPTIDGIKQHLKPLLHFFLSASVISIYVFFDVIILGRFASHQSVGYYATAIKIVKLSLLLVLSLNVILFPRIAHLTVSSSQTRIRELIQKSFQYIIVTTVPIGFFFYFLAGELIHIIAGKSFSAAIPLMKVLCVLPFIVGCSNLFVYQVLVPFSREKKLLLSVAIACVTSLLLNVLLASAMAEKGTALATVLTELTVTILTGFFALRTIRFSLPFATFYQSALCCLPFIAILFLTRQYSSNNFLIVGVSCTAGFACYSLLQKMVFKNMIYQQVWKEVEQRVAYLNHKI